MDSLPNYDNWKLQEPENDTGEKQKCALCGYLEIIDENNHCKDCKPIICVLCASEEPASETHSGICRDCIKERAGVEEVAIKYAQSADDDDTAKYISENVAYYLFSKSCKENGENVFTHYAFFIAEMKEVINGKLKYGYEWEIPRFNTISQKVIMTGIENALSMYCLDDESHFAKWLAKEGIA